VVARLVPTGVACVCLMIALAGCGKSQSTSDRQARQILDSAVVPPAASRVTALIGSAFARPAESPRCQPVVDESRYWVVSQSSRDVVSFLKSHAPAWIPNKGGGSYTDRGVITSSFVTDFVTGAGWNTNDQLDFTVASISGGETGSRGDAEVVPPDATCESDGGPS
jgi:hypothetical protein